MPATSTGTPTEAGVPELSLRPVGVEARRRNVRSILLSILAVVVVAAAATAVSHSAIFGLQRLSVSGNHALTAEDVARAAGLAKGSNVVWLSTARVERQLLRDPWIAQAHVSRSLPASVMIAVRERVPVAVAARPGGPGMLVARDGVVLGLALPTFRLPMVQLPSDLDLKVGSRVPVNAPALRAAAGFPPDVAARISVVSLGREGIELHTRDGVRVVYGDASAPGAKGIALQAVLIWLEQHRVEPLYVDVSAPTAPAVMPVNGQLTGVAGGAAGSSSGGTVNPIGPGASAPPPVAPSPGG